MNKFRSASIILFLISITACENRDGINKNIQSSASEKQIEVISPVEKSSKIRPSFMTKNPLEMGGKCNMEMVNWHPWSSIAHLDRSLPILQISGWGADSDAKKSPNEIYLRMQDQAGNEFYGKTEKTYRKDVAEHFKESFYEKSGYRIKVDIQNMPDATYDVVIVMETNEKSILCSSGQKLIIESKN